MARLTQHPQGAPCWIDITTSDVARARDFYCTLFGWTADEPNEQLGGYFTFYKDGARVAGGMGRMPEQQGPDAWSVHLCTSDARATLENAKGRGAQVVVDAMDVQDLGTMIGVLDPSGAYVGGWQPGAHTGFEVAYENGAPVWFELHTRNYDAALDFYRDVFGWKTVTASDTPELRYTLLQPGETQLAGIMDDTPHSPDTVPSHWTVYFGVADADAAAARIKELGGSIVMEPMDTPYGRLAACTDPTGAAFNLMQATPAMPMGAGSETASSSAH